MSVAQNKHSRPWTRQRQRYPAPGIVGNYQESQQPIKGRAKKHIPPDSDEEEKVASKGVEQVSCMKERTGQYKTIMRDTTRQLEHDLKSKRSADKTSLIKEKRGLKSCLKSPSPIKFNNTVEDGTKGGEDKGETNEDSDRELIDQGLWWTVGNGIYGSR